MLPAVYRGVVTTIALEEDAPLALANGGDDDCFGGGCSAPLGAVVTTITLEDDALGSLLPSGEDDPWRRMLRQLC